MRSSDRANQRFRAASAEGEGMCKIHRAVKLAGGCNDLHMFDIGATSFRFTVSSQRVHNMGSTCGQLGPTQLQLAPNSPKLRHIGLDLGCDFGPTCDQLTWSMVGPRGAVFGGSSSPSWTQPEPTLPTQRNMHKRPFYRYFQSLRAFDGGSYWAKVPRLWARVGLNLGCSPC